MNRRQKPAIQEDKYFYFKLLVNTNVGIPGMSAIWDQQKKIYTYTAASHSFYFKSMNL